MFGRFSSWLFCASRLHSSHSLHHSAANLPSDCINLGQGYMNFAPPKWIVDSAETALRSVAGNHYSHPRGRIRLREALKKFYDPLFGRDMDVNSEILVTSGANEGTYAIVNSTAIFIHKYHRSILCLHCLSGTWRRSNHVRAVL